MSALQRFFVSAAAVQGDRATLVGDQAKQVAAVLRLGSGDRVVLVRDGEELEIRLETVTRSRAEGVIVGRRRCPAEPRLRLTLALPLLRGDRALEVVEAVTQLGVSRIVPFTSERSVVRGLSATKRERWERIARESAETARRGRVPEIAAAVGWAELFDVLGSPVIVAWEAERGRPLTVVIPPAATRVSVAIGPEGGLTADEVSLARDRGAVTASLGPRNLRSETAAVAAVALILAALGD